MCGEAVERTEDGVDVGEYPVSGVDIVLRDVFPNLVEIVQRIRMEA